MNDFWKNVTKLIQVFTLNGFVFVFWQWVLQDLNAFLKWAVLIVILVNFNMMIVMLTTYFGSMLEYWASYLKKR